MERLPVPLEEKPKFISICFTSRISLLRLAYLRLPENMFYINYLPFIKCIVGDRIIDVHIYGELIENADIIINKKDQIDIILKLIDNETNSHLYAKQIRNYFQLNHSKINRFISLFKKINKLPQIIKDNIILYKGAVFTIYGLRSYTNIDIYFRYLPLMRTEDIKKFTKICGKFRKKINLTFSEKVKGFEAYFNKKDNKFKKGWAKQSGLYDFSDILEDGNYIYFCGLKFLRFDINIVYYYRINTINSYADIIMSSFKIDYRLKSKPIKSSYSLITNDKLVERDEGYEIEINNETIYYFKRCVSFFEMIELIQKDINTRYNVRFGMKRLINELSTSIKIRTK